MATLVVTVSVQCRRAGSGLRTPPGCRFGCPRERVDASMDDEWGRSGKLPEAWSKRVACALIAHVCPEGQIADDQ